MSLENKFFLREVAFGAEFFDPLAEGLKQLLVCRVKIKLYALYAGDQQTMSINSGCRVQPIVGQTARNAECGVWNAERGARNAASLTAEC